MERNVQRIDGVRTHLHLLSQEELEAERGYALERAHEAYQDIEKIEGELCARRNIGEVAVAPVLEATPAAQQYFQRRFGEIQ